MSEHPNVVRMREGYEAFAKGDLDTLRQLWTDDIRWHEGGHSDFAGTYEGPEAVFAVEPRAFLADDHYGATPVTLTAHRGDRTVEVLNVHLTRFENGKVAEFWDTSTDEDTLDRFFA